MHVLRKRVSVWVRVAVGCALLWPALARAAVWTNANGDFNWATAANWNPTIPDGPGAVAEFSTIDLTLDTTVNTGASRTVGSLLFADTTPGNNWFLSGPAPGTILTLNATAGTPTITVNN